MSEALVIALPLTSNAPPNCGEVSSNTLFMPPPPAVALIVNVLVPALSVNDTLVPAIRLNESVELSAVMLTVPVTPLPLTATVLNAFWFASPEPNVDGSTQLLTPASVDCNTKPVVAGLPNESSLRPNALSTSNSV